MLGKRWQKDQSKQGKLITHQYPLHFRRKSTGQSGNVLSPVTSQPIGLPQSLSDLFPSRTMPNDFNTIKVNYHAPNLADNAHIQREQAHGDAGQRTAKYTNSQIVTNFPVNFHLTVLRLCKPDP